MTSQKERVKAIKLTTKRKEKTLKVNRHTEQLIKDAIAHLNGYALCMQTMTGYKPVAVYDCIKDLKRLI